MEKQEKNNNNLEEIELPNVQKSVLDYYADQLEKEGEIPKIDQTIAKMQMHVYLTELENKKAKKELKEKSKKEDKKETKAQEGREL